MKQLSSAEILLSSCEVASLEDSGTEGKCPPSSQYRKCHAAAVFPRFD